VGSGADALTQAIESFTSLGANELTDALALRAFMLIARSITKVVDGSENNIEAHADMAYGSMLAGMALANARLGAVHGMAHPLGVRYKIPHGICCAILLPAVMEFNEPAVADKYAQLSAIVGQPVIGWVAELFQRIGIPTTFAQYSIPQEDIEAIAQESLPSGSLKANPRPPSAEDLARILGKMISNSPLAGIE
jgi:alcohol dehydrogenase class IV